MEVDFEPTRDFVLIEPISQGKTAGGLALPEGASLGCQQGLVVKVGPGVTSEFGVQMPNYVKPGDVIYLGFAVQQVGTVQLKGKEYIICRQRDIIGTIPQKKAKLDECSQACCARPEPAMALN